MNTKLPPSPGPSWPRAFPALRLAVAAAVVSVLAGCATNTPPLPPKVRPKAQALRVMSASLDVSESSDSGQSSAAQEVTVVSWGEDFGIVGRNCFTWVLPDATRCVLVQTWTNGVAAPDYVHDREVYGPALFVQPGPDLVRVMKATSLPEGAIQ